MRILVTGANSIVGRTAAVRMRAAGHDVSEMAQQSSTLQELTDAADAADAVVHLAPIEPAVPDSAGIDGLIRVCDAAARVGARLLFLSHAAGDPALYRQAEELVDSSWAPSLIIRIAPLVGREQDWPTARSVASLANIRGSGDVRLLHSDDLYRFLIRSVGSHRTGTVDLAGADHLSAASVRRWLGPVPRRRRRNPWVNPCVEMDTTALQRDWDFECGWRCNEALVDTGRLHGSRLDIDSPRSEPDGADETLTGQLTPMTLDLRSTALPAAHRRGAQTVGAPGGPTRHVRALAVARRYPTWGADYAVPQRVLAARPATLTDAQLDIRISLLREHIQHGWVLSTVGVRLAELLVRKVGHRALTLPELTELAEPARATAARAPQAAKLTDRVYTTYEVVNAETARAVDQLREALDEKGSRMTVRRMLAVAEDIFYLTVDEVLAPPVDTRLRVNRRKLARDQLLTVDLPEPDFALVDIISELEPQGQA